MKKSNNSNPLKYFNDAAASRKKSVNTGNDKLVKAHVGVVTKVAAKNDNDKYAENKERVKKYLTDPINANPPYKNRGKAFNVNPEAYNEGRDTTNMKFIRYENYPKNTYGIPVGPDINNNFYQRKKGGQVKSKKK